MESSGVHGEEDMDAEFISENDGLHVQTEGGQAKTQRLSTDTQNIRAEISRVYTENYGIRTEHDVRDATNESAFWMALEDLWTTQYVAPADLGYVDFNRTHSKIASLYASNYLATSTDAFKDTTVEAVDSSRISLSYRPDRKDVFGDVKPGSHLPDTYLLPASPMSARNWYIVVPWILPNVPATATNVAVENVEDMANEESELWMRRMSKCVNGSTNKDSHGMGFGH
jgi:hypothetical protein